MLLEIDHHSGQPIYRQVMEQIRRQILVGQLAEGQQLVSVRELAGQLNVNPMTISKAYGLLEMEGLLERRRGVGLFVAGLEQEKKSASKGELLERILGKAVAAAVQFGISEDEVKRLTERLFERYGSSVRRDEHE